MKSINNLKIEWEKRTHLLGSWPTDKTSSITKIFHDVSASLVKQAGTFRNYAANTAPNLDKTQLANIVVKLTALLEIHSVFYSALKEHLLLLMPNGLIGPSKLTDKGMKLVALCTLNTTTGYVFDPLHDLKQRLASINQNKKEEPRPVNWVGVSLIAWSALALLLLHRSNWSFKQLIWPSR